LEDFVLHFLHLLLDLHDLVSVIFDLLIVLLLVVLSEPHLLHHLPGDLPDPPLQLDLSRLPFAHEPPDLEPLGTAHQLHPHPLIHLLEDVLVDDPLEQGRVVRGHLLFDH
jgi:hypothetical protein